MQITVFESVHPQTLVLRSFMANVATGRPLPTRMNLAGWQILMPWHWSEAECWLGQTRIYNQASDVSWSESVVAKPSGGECS